VELERFWFQVGPIQLDLCKHDDDQYDYGRADDYV
jgi:hypothetical protein